MSAVECLRAADLMGALAALQNDVREDPGRVEHRVFLFQLLVVLGQWERALKQLQVVAELDPGAIPMAQTYREAIRCEVLRAQVFAGQRAPLLIGEPPGWVALLLEALRQAEAGEHEHASALRAEAMEKAPATAGTLGEEPFEWIADADPRLGPIFEVIANGRYFWIPFESLAKIRFEKPEDLRDMVWLPAYVTLANGGELPSLIPTRYPGSELREDGLLRMARKTDWIETPSGQYGLGQRMLITDKSDHALLDVRQISLQCRS